MNKSPLVDSSFLTTDPRVVRIDARSGPSAFTLFQENHLAGAQWVNLEIDLAEVPNNPAFGGRHPLPSPQKFSAVLERLGIWPDATVVVYDDKNGANAAARFWWMLRSAGHQNVFVLDGGFQAAVDAGFPLESGLTTVRPVSVYPIAGWFWPVLTLPEIVAGLESKTIQLIDVRDGVRYRGEKEPIDRIAGHIPGAQNVPFSANLDASGRFRSAAELNALYAEFMDTKPVAIHCGSGVTACHTILAFAHAGREIPALYVGSWSEWSNAGMPVATGPV